MPVRLMPANVLKAMLGIEPNGKVQRFFTNDCARRMDKYIPMDIGNLRINKEVQVDKVIYHSPYATYQYNGVRASGTHKVRNYTTPGTGPYWDKRMWAAEGQDVVKAIQEKFGGK